jgi:hypothetical protein
MSFLLWKQRINSLRSYRLGISSTFLSFRLWSLLAQTPLEFPAHSHQPGDHIPIKVWKGSMLEPSWEGPYQVLLTTRTDVWTTKWGWIHCTRAKSTPVLVTAEKEWWMVVPQTTLQK